MLERVEELEKIKKQQRETGEELTALRQRFEDQGVAAAESAAEVAGPAAGRTIYRREGGREGSGAPRGGLPSAVKSRFQGVSVA